MQSIKTAVFPVAGLGTRFLPATKSMAKEMLTIVDKPLIQYAAEEAIEAGITKLVFIVGRTKNSVIDHFDKAYELETELSIRNKQDMLEIVQNVVPEGIQCVFIRQSDARGLGHAVLCAEPAVGDQPFAVLLPDDLIHNEEKGCIRQMCEVYEERQASIIGSQTIAIEDSSKYGMVAGPNISDRVASVNEIVEKPDPADAPSDQAVVGRYILSSKIFDLLRKTGKGAGGEIQLTDAIAELMKQEPIYAYSFEGTRYDCGSKFGYLQATVEFALAHPELSDEFSAYLKSL